MIAIDKITLAVRDMDAMKAFYGALLEVDFDRMDMAGFHLYQARRDEVTLLLCPAELAGVDASVNTVQPRLVLGDMERALQRALAHGGTLLSAPALVEGRLQASLRDPDNNSLELSAPAGDTPFENR